LFLNHEAGAALPRFAQTVFQQAFGLDKGIWRCELTCFAFSEFFQSEDIALQRQGGLSATYYFRAGFSDEKRALRTRTMSEARP
jgi:hypothetical protein